MPHCIFWDDADWDFARETLKLMHDFYAGKTSLASEIRLRGVRMGTTWDARRDLRIRYVDPTEEKRPDMKKADYLKRVV